MNYSQQFFQTHDPALKAKARALAEEALRLSPALGEAHLALGLYFDFVELDYSAALEQFTIALNALPNNVEVLRYAAIIYRRHGRWREAMEVIDTAYANLPSQQAGMQSQAAVYAAYCLVSLGQLVELRRRSTQLRADAEQRGDLFTQVMLSASHPLILKLADDDPESARAAIREAKEALARNYNVPADSIEIIIKG